MTGSHPFPVRAAHSCYSCTTSRHLANCYPLWWRNHRYASGYFCHEHDPQGPRIHALALELHTSLSWTSVHPLPGHVVPCRHDRPAFRFALYLRKARLMMMMTYPVSRHSPPPGAACLHDVRAATTSDNAAMARVLEGRIFLRVGGQLYVNGSLAMYCPE